MSEIERAVREDIRGCLAGEFGCVLEDVAHDQLICRRSNQPFTVWVMSNTRKITVSVRWGDKVGQRGSDQLSVDICDPMAISRIRAMVIECFRVWWFDEACYWI